MAVDEEFLPTPARGCWACMPAEIRLQIFGKCVENRSVGLLCASKRLYEEFRPLLYEKFVLAFTIDPAASSSNVRILGQNGCTVDTTSPHHDYASILKNMPIDQFRRIEITFLNAPNPDDPGQLVQAWRQITGLTAALLPRISGADTPELNDYIIKPTGQKTSVLPPMIVRFRETNGQSWTSRESSSPTAPQMWNHSISSRKGWNHWNLATRALIRAAGSRTDMEIILTAFLRVRHAPLTIQFPDHINICPSEDNKIAILMEEIARVNGIPFTFGAYVDFNRDVSSRHSDDEEIILREDSWHVWLDYLLDDLEGPTASRLRLERFESWCAEYEYLLGLRVTRLQRILGDDAVWDQFQQAFMDRFVAAVIHSSIASGPPPQETSHQEIRSRAGAFDTIRGAWKASFPDGITRKSENRDFWPAGVRNELIRRPGVDPFNLKLPEDRLEVTISLWFRDQFPLADNCETCHHGAMSMPRGARSNWLHERQALLKYLNEQYCKTSKRWDCPHENPRSQNWSTTPLSSCFETS